MNTIYTILGVAAFIGLIFALGKFLGGPPMYDSADEAAEGKLLTFDLFDDDQGRWWAVDDNDVTHGPFASSREALTYAHQHGRVK